MFLVSLSIAQAQTACEASTVTCGGYTINETGFGAVQICGECAPCGVDDGICPEKYTDGQDEVDYNKTQFLFSVPINLRPLAIKNNIVSNAYNTGNEACTTLGNAGCTNVFSYPVSDFSAIYSDSPPATVPCTDLYSSHPNNYLVANCTGVKRTAGCQWCVDPDCTANVRGLAWSSSDNTSIPANITITSNYNYLIESNVASAANGTFSLESPIGNVKFLCAKEDYIPVTKNIYVHDGTNIVDCPLKEAYCSAECTMPNAQGQEVCRSSCDGKNGCSINSTCENPDTGAIIDVSGVCAGSPPGTTKNILDLSNDRVLYVNCCSQTCGTREYKTLNIQAGDNIRNLVTKTYQKKINGDPVNLKVIIYENNLN